LSPVHRGIAIVAILSVIFGLIEIDTAFTHNFAGIVSTAQGETSACWSAVIGSCYAFAGLFLWTRRKWGASLAIGLYGVDVAGRIGLVATGLYPLSSVENQVAIVSGTAIAILFALYVAIKKGSLPR
jgi:hypothetical protein